MRGEVAAGAARGPRADDGVANALLALVANVALERLEAVLRGDRLVRERGRARVGRRRAGRRPSASSRPSPARRAARPRGSAGNARGPSAIA